MNNILAWVVAGLMICAAEMGYATPVILETHVNPTNGITYHLLSPGTWTEEEAAAILMGGHLVSINDAVENDWVFQTYGVSRNLWIGLNADAAGWHWSDGDAVIYTNFWDLSHGYPVEPYVVMGAGFAGRWDDWGNATPWPVNGGPIYGVAEIAVVTVPVDIKPGGFPNAVNPRSNGVIPVAILTTDSFEASIVDPATVLFGATGSEAAPTDYALEDVNGDGRLDMILHFSTHDTGIACGATSASLTGKTISGQVIKGSDSVLTVGCK